MKLMPLIIYKKDFGKFNNAEEDRFGLFEQQIRKKMNLDINNRTPFTAYNYQRFNPEIESEEWKINIHEWTEQLFNRYQYLMIQTGGEIFGVCGKKRKLLKTDPIAYSVAKSILSE